MTKLGALSALGIVAGLYLVGGCASSGPCEVQAVDGFYATCTQETMKEVYGLDLVLPMAEDEFLASISHLDFEPPSKSRHVPYPQEAGHLDRATVSHIIYLMPKRSPDAHPWSGTKRYIAYVVNGEVVAVENEHGAVTPIG